MRKSFVRKVTDVCEAITNGLVAPSVTTRVIYPRPNLLFHMFEEKREAVMAIETAYSVRATNANSPISVPRPTTMIARKNLLMPGLTF